MPGSYNQTIDRQNPALFIFLLDQSFSMEEPLGNSSQRKMDELALALNGWLQNMVITATKDDGIRNYMDIAVIGYRTDQEANPILESPLCPELKNQTCVSIVDISNHPRIEKRTRQFLDEDTNELMQAEEEVPVWVDAVAEGGTPMCTALHKAYEIASEWIPKHMNSFPPIVIHITDGESSEGDPLPYAEPLKDLATDYGNLLLLNCHLSATAADPFKFPASAEILPDELARVLFKMSSVVPEVFVKRARELGLEVQEGARCMVFNADMVTLIRFLDFGTKVALR